MYPPVTGLLAKQTPKEGAYIDGKFAPSGTWIAWNSWGIMRDQDIFGIDAEVFRPERWVQIDGSAEERARVDRMTETVGLVFGYGRFGCLGRGVATMELNKGIIEVRVAMLLRVTVNLIENAEFGAQTLLRFELQSTNPSHPFVERCVGFFLHEKMSFRISAREENPDPSQAVGDDKFDNYEVAALPGAPDE